MKGEFKRHVPTILTCLGAIGTVTTTVLAVRATPKALRLLEEAEREKREELTKTEILKVAGPCYIPAMLSGIATIACIFGSNALNLKRQTSLMSAYLLLDNAYNDYSNKVKDSVGEQEEARIRDAIANDKDVPDECSRQLFYDMHFCEYFESSLDFVTLDDGLECYIIDTASMFQNREKRN